MTLKQKFKSWYPKKAECLVCHGQVQEMPTAPLQALSELGVQRVDQIHSLTGGFSRYLVSTYNLAANKTGKHLCCYGAYILVQELFKMRVRYIVHKVVESDEKNEARKGSQLGKGWGKGACDLM